MKLNYKKYGEGETTLVILHGLLGSLDNWQTLARSWSSHFTVYAIDLRNHGRSDHSDEFSLGLMAEDVITWCGQQGIQKSNFLGHSMGGKVVMEIALNHPELCETLIVVDIAPKSYERGHDHIFNALLKVPIQSINERDQVEAILAQEINDRGTLMFLMKNLHRSEAGNHFKWKMNLPAIWNHYDEINKAIKTDKIYLGPTLFIKGDRSNYILEDDWELILTLFPFASMAVIKNAGHWVHADQQAEVIQVVHQFISSSIL